jgi:hypothetical protein
MTARKTSSSRQTGQVTLQNRLSPQHPQRLALETSIRNALAGLTGNWDVVLEVPQGPSLVIAVIAPDGSSWTMSCCNPAYRDPESIAQTVRAACSRRRWHEPSVAASVNAGGGAASLGPPAAFARDTAKSVAPPTPNREAGQPRLAGPGETTPMPLRGQDSGGNHS